MSQYPTWSRRDVLRLAGATAGTSVLAHSASSKSHLSMPGLYPGRVIGVTHAGSSIGGQYQAAAIQEMIRQGMAELANTQKGTVAWRQLFSPNDVVGIKVNPNGIVISSQACLVEIIRGLQSAGVALKNIVVYERYQDLLNTVVPWVPAGVRTSWASPTYTDDQTGISGYDPDHYVDLPQYLLPWQSATNPAHRRSYAALFVTQQVTKIISLACLKDHQAAGVTLSLKNLSHGCANNVDRSHPDVTLNYTRDFIPAVVAMPVIRNKTVLSIIDGVHGLYASGPHGLPQFVWEHKTMYFATDVVAADRIGWRAIDEKRVSAGMLPEALAPADAWDQWQVRQPQHIEVAGQMGLGEWRDDHIDFRQISIG